MPGTCTVLCVRFRRIEVPHNGQSLVLVAGGMMLVTVASVCCLDKVRIDPYR